MLSFKEFTNKLVDCLKENISKNVEISVATDTKSNISNAVSLVFKNGSDLSPSITINRCYQEEYLKKKRSIQEIAEEIKESYEQSQKVPFNASVDTLKDYEFVKKNSYIKLLNYEKNTEYLKDKIYDRIEDLAAVYCVSVISDDHKMGTISVTDKYLEALNVSKEQFREDALINMKETTNLQSISEVIGDFPFTDDADMYILSNRNMVNGAGQILASDVAEKLLNLDKGDEFFVFPSSVHELIFLPVNKFSYEDLDYLKSLVTSINETEVSNADFLSNSVYMYNARNRKFSLAENKEKEEEYEMR